MLRKDGVIEGIWIPDRAHSSDEIFHLNPANDHYEIWDIGTMYVTNLTAFTSSSFATPTLFKYLGSSVPTTKLPNTLIQFVH